MKKLFTSRILALAITSFAFAKDIATVNGKSIPMEKSDILVKNYIARGNQDTPELRKAIREELIIDEVMVQEAEKQGLANDSTFKQQMDMARREMLKEALIRNYLKNNPISDKEVKARYDEWFSLNQGKQYHAKHILVKTESEAKAIISQLNKGANFEKLASSKSLDGSKVNGGDLGWAPATSYVKPFAEAMMALNKGKITSSPIASPFGYHIIKLIDSKSLPTYDQMKARVRNDIEKVKCEQYINSLREKSKIE